MPVEPVKVTIDARPVMTGGTPAPAPGEAAATAPPGTAIVPPKAEAPPKPDDRFAKLARIEAKNRARERELKAAEAELETRAKQVQEREALFAAAKDDPKRLAEIYGDKFYDRITEAHLNGDKFTPEQIAQQALDEAKAARADMAKREAALVRSQKEAAEAEWRQTVDNYGAALLESIEADPVKYAATKAMGDGGLLDVKQTIIEMQMEHFKRTSKALAVSEALDLLEAHAKATVAKLTTASAAAATANPTAPPAQGSRASQPSRSEPRGTLTNSLTSAPTVPPSPRPKTAYERALAAMEAASATRTTNG